MALQFSGSLLVSGSITVTGAVTATQAYSTAVFTDMAFSHVSGTADFVAGVGIPISSSIGFGAGVNADGSIYLTPTASAPLAKYAAFRTDNKPIQIVGYRIFTNISGSDFPQYDYNANGTKISRVSVGLANLSATSSAYSGQPLSYNMFSTVSGSYNGADGYWSTISAGAIKHSTAEIGDAGTLYLTSSNTSFVLSPTAYSPTYYTFLMSIGAAFATKTYKFRFEVDYQAI